MSKRNDPDAILRLERQVERGCLFNHTVLSGNSDRINEIESFLYGIIDLLVDKGIVTAQDISKASENVSFDMKEKGEIHYPDIAFRVDGVGKKEDSFVPVNCDERRHICKAVCCGLDFALSVEEVESGRIKWDFGRPYYNRKEQTGQCAHTDPDTKSCQIYHDRPVVCCKYSCADDKRIWKDFNKMELNEEWICENIGHNRPHLATALMHRLEDIKSIK
jgi:Fe-S-cluster containining protein